MITAKWRELIGYKNQSKPFTTNFADVKDILNAGRKIYEDYPKILKALAPNPDELELVRLVQYYKL
jgi:hypothetical protein